MYEKICNECEYLSLSEYEQQKLMQNGIHKKHICNKYNKRVFHYTQSIEHSDIIYACRECIEEGK